MTDINVDPTVDEIQADEPISLPVTPVPVAVQGLVRVQELPTQAGAVRTVQLVPGAVAIKVAKPDPRRRRLLIVSDQPLYFGYSQAEADAASAPYLPANILVPITNRDAELWVRAATQNPAAVDTPGSMTSAVPGAGAEASIVSSGTWTVESVFVTLATSATVANRRFTLVFDNGSTSVRAKVTAPTDQAAGTSVDYSLAIGQADPGAVRAGVQMLSLPEITVPSGSRLITSTSGLQAGDQYTALTLRIRNSVAPNAVNANLTIVNDQWTQ